MPVPKLVTLVMPTKPPKKLRAPKTMSGMVRTTSVPNTSGTLSASASRNSSVSSLFV